MNSKELYNRFFLITDLYLPDGTSLKDNPNLLTELREMFEGMLTDKVDCCFYYRWWFPTARGFNEPILRIVVGFKKGGKFTGNCVARNGDSIEFNELVGSLWDSVLKLNGFTCLPYEYLIAADYHRVREPDINTTKRLVGAPVQQKDQQDKLHCYHVNLRRDRDTKHVKALTNPIMRGISYYRDRYKISSRDLDESIAIMTLNLADITDESSVKLIIEAWANENEEVVLHRRLRKGYYIFVLIRARTRIEARTQADYLYRAIEGVVERAEILYFRDFESVFIRKQPFNNRVDRILDAIGRIEDAFNNRHLFEEGYESALTARYFQYP